MIFEEIKTARLLLRKLIPGTYSYIYQNYSEDELMNFLALKTAEELDIEKEKYRQGISMHNRSFVNFQLLDILTGNHIGNCGFHTWYPMHSRAEIGYAITDDSLKGKGLMSEAMGKIIDYGFENMNLIRIEAFIGPDNIPSLKLINKFGFSKEGHLREHYHKNSKIYDSFVFSLLRHEYKHLSDQ